MEQILKYPRTQHIQGSRLQDGDEDLSQVPWADLAGKHLIIEEKIDGANTGISFDSDGEIWLQCRGHYLTGGAGEKQFALFKQWAATHQNWLFDRLEDRYVMYGEWMYAKHTVFYDALPHYFMEFDIYDKQKKIFLSTKARRHVLQGRILIEPVLVLGAGNFASLEDVLDNVTNSYFKTTLWRQVLKDHAENLGQDYEKVRLQTDPSNHMEGLYIKWEDEEQVLGRYKWIRPDFVQAILEAGDHWKARPILPNLLRPGVNIFEVKYG